MGNKQTLTEASSIINGNEDDSDENASGTSSVELHRANDRNSDIGRASRRNSDIGRANRRNSDVGRASRRNSDVSLSMSVDSSSNVVEEFLNNHGTSSALFVPRSDSFSSLVALNEDDTSEIIIDENENEHNINEKSGVGILKSSSFCSRTKNDKNYDRPIMSGIPKYTAMPSTRRGKNPHLLSLTWAREWPEVLVRCQHNPEEAFQYNSRFGRTPLHLSMFSRDGCRPRVLIALLKANKHASVVRDKIGFTPLHYACQFGAGESLIVLLAATAVSVDLDLTFPTRDFCNDSKGKSYEDDQVDLNNYIGCDCYFDCKCPTCPITTYNRLNPVHMLGIEDNDKESLLEQPYSIPSPLYLACKRGASIDILRLLINQSRKYSKLLFKRLRSKRKPFSEKDLAHSPCVNTANLKLRSYWIAPFTGGEPWFFFRECDNYENIPSSDSTSIASSSSASIHSNNPEFEWSRSTLSNHLHTNNQNIDNFNRGTLIHDRNQRAERRENPPNNTRRRAVFFESDDNREYEDNRNYLYRRPTTYNRTSGVSKSAELIKSNTIFSPLEALWESYESEMEQTLGYILNALRKKNIHNLNYNDAKINFYKNHGAFWEKVLLLLRSGQMNTKESLSISVTSFTKFPLLNSRLRSEFHYDTEEHNFLDGAFDDFCLDHMFEDTKVQDNSRVKPSYSETVNNNIRIRNDNESRKNTLSVLHVIASLKTPMPGLLTCALFLHPKDLTQRDECGMLPLHHAILSYNPSSCHSRGKKRGSDNFEFENTERDIYYNENEAQEGNQYICEKDRPFFLRRCEIISVLVHSCVPSASYLSPDGDLPINMVSL